MLATQGTVRAWATGLSLALCSIPNIACSEGHRNLGGAPTPLPVVSSPGGVPTGSGQQLTLGELFHGTVRATDSPCDTDPLTDAPNPCLRFRAAIPGPGYVGISVKFDPLPDTYVTLLFGSFFLQGQMSDRIVGRSLPAPAGIRPPGTICSLTRETGNSIKFAVALHAGTSPVEFDLTTSWASDSDAVFLPGCRD